MSSSSPKRVGRTLVRFGLAKAVVVALALGLIARALLSEPVQHVPQSRVSDWRNYHTLHPTPRRSVAVARGAATPIITKDSYPRRQQDWWPQALHARGKMNKGGNRDWNVSIGTARFEPLFDFSFNILNVPPETGYGSLNTIDEETGEFLATSGSMTVTGGADQGTFSLYPGGPGETGSPAGGFDFNDLLYILENPTLDMYGLLFTGPGIEINIWGNGTNNYSFYDYFGGDYHTRITGTGSVTFTPDPGGGQTYPSKFVFDVTAPPSCTADFVVLGIPANTTLGGQANIVGYNYLYSASTGTPFCGTATPNVMFAYASGSGQVPNFVTISQSGTQLAYVENLQTGSSYFHVLTIGTSGDNGTDPTMAVVPGNGNNAVDYSVLLSPDGGMTNQGSTNAPFVVYTGGDANDFAYVTTYSTAAGGSGYLYKITNVFNPMGAAPTIAWSLPIDTMPSTPLFDDVSGQVFFTDSSGRIDYVYDNGVTPPAEVVYGPVFAPGATSENALTLDYTNQLLYACFNSNGTNAIVVQATRDLSSSVTVPVGAAATVYTGPYGVAFNNAFYTGSGTPLLYVAGTSAAAVPTLYGVGFNMDGTLNPSDVTTAALATGPIDVSPVTEFYNATQGVDYLFVGVTDDCVATMLGGMNGCVLSLDITNGFPTITNTTTALPATGGTTGIVVDNDSAANQASSIYFATKTGNSLVKATQSGLQ